MVCAFIKFMLLCEQNKTFLTTVGLNLSIRESVSVEYMSLHGNTFVIKLLTVNFFISYVVGT